jgi:hypothetical protein
MTSLRLLIKGEELSSAGFIADFYFLNISWCFLCSFLLTIVVVPLVLVPLPLRVFFSSKPGISWLRKAILSVDLLCEPADMFEFHSVTLMVCFYI